MGIAALITWIVTAAIGFTLLSLWLRRGGLRQQAARRTSFPSGLVFGHFLLAAAGLVLWIVYVATDSESLTWLSLGVLVVVAVLGGTMFFRWFGVRRAAVGATAPGAGAAAPAAGASPEEPAEQGFPVAFVAAHGLFAVVTVVLVLLAALEIGD
jgi:hypothetical protein